MWFQFSWSQKLVQQATEQLTLTRASKDNSVQVSLGWFPSFPNELVVRLSTNLWPQRQGARENLQ